MIALKEKRLISDPGIGNANHNWSSSSQILEEIDFN